MLSLCLLYHYLYKKQSPQLANQFKPAILQCFGDIAGAIGGHFETYLSVVAQVLQQAAGVTADPNGSYEMFDYVISLREGIMDAWGGIIGAMKTSGKSKFPASTPCSRNWANGFQLLYCNPSWIRSSSYSTLCILIRTEVMRSCGRRWV